MNTRRKSRRRFAASQRGQVAIIALLLMIGAGVTILVYNLATPAKLSIERDKKTAEALAQAKAALIGYAVSVDLSGAGRPGDLLCPDTNDDGSAETSCGNAAGTTGQANRLGRLPWRTLGLPDLRDGDGERLWYAVSNNFKNNTRTPCAAPGDAGCLNSDARGTITIVDSTGTILNDGRTTNGIIAVVFSAGSVLRRQDGTIQTRSCTVGVDCNASQVCTTTAAPKCDPVNYLDVLVGVEDNAAFVDGNTGDATTNGFIAGELRDASNNLVVNDRLLTISAQDMMPQLERRVSKEVLNCLTAYAAANSGRYPWAAPVTDVTPPYGDLVNNRFGRIPDAPMSQTVLGVVSVATLPIGPLLQTACIATPALCMQTDWTPTCSMIDPLTPLPYTQRPWWTNWKEMVFYAVSPAYSPRISFVFILLPASVTLSGITPTTGCPTCITVNPPSATADKRIAVMAAGRLLTGQSRAIAADKQTQTNYLENENNTPADNIFTNQTSSTTFNDVLLFFQ